jgi:hypothetical protein
VVAGFEYGVRTTLSILTRVIFFLLWTVRPIVSIVLSLASTLSLVASVIWLILAACKDWNSALLLSSAEFFAASYLTSTALWHYNALLIKLKPKGVWITVQR